MTKKKEIWAVNQEIVCSPHLFLFRQIDTIFFHQLHQGEGKRKIHLAFTASIHLEHLTRLLDLGSCKQHRPCLLRIWGGNKSLTCLENRLWGTDAKINFTNTNPHMATFLSYCILSQMTVTPTCSYQWLGKQHTLQFQRDSWFSPSWDPWVPWSVFDPVTCKITQCPVLQLQGSLLYLAYTLSLQQGEKGQGYWICAPEVFPSFLTKHVLVPNKHHVSDRGTQKTQLTVVTICTWWQPQNPFTLFLLSYTKPVSYTPIHLASKQSCDGKVIHLGTAGYTYKSCVILIFIPHCLPI